jgi:hypothetical protein
MDEKLLITIGMILMGKTKELRDSATLSTTNTI